MGSTAYGFPRWMARLGLVNVWIENKNKVYFDNDFDMWEEGMPRSAGDYPNRKNKLMALGNAVVPQCVELVGRLIKRADELGTMVFDTRLLDERH